jgi:hypothetical protein
MRGESAWKLPARSGVRHREQATNHAALPTNVPSSIFLPRAPSVTPRNTNHSDLDTFLVLTQPWTCDIEAFKTRISLTKHECRLLGIQISDFLFPISRA